MALSEEQASRLVTKRPKCSAAEAHFAIADSDATKIWSITEAAAGLSERNTKFVNRWASVLRNCGLRAEELLEQLADLIVNNLVR